MEKAGIRLTLSAALLALLTACGGGSYDGDENATAVGEAPSGASDASSVRGRSIYVEQCQVCHGSDGRGSAAGSSLVDCPTCGDVGTLSNHISLWMPTANPAQCEAQCAVDVATYILSAYNGTDSPDDSPEPTPEPPAPPAPPPQDGVNQAGQSSYANQCASCHGADGTGTPRGPSLAQCGSCSSLNTLSNRIASTMPLSAPERCVGDCASNIAEYILQAFNGDNSTNDQAIFNEVILRDLKTTFRKASLNLAARLPRAAELSQLGQEDEAAFDQLLDGLMQEPAFYQRMMEIWNDFLLQDKYLGGENAISLLRSSDFPQRRWYDELGLNRDEAGPERDLYFYLRSQSNDAMAREALLLITHILRNDRPITEMLTANYVVANYYSARSYGAEGQHSWDRLDNPPFPEYPYDPEDYREIQLIDPEFGQFPHAGLMTSVMFLNRFPTTNTNRNRHRSRMIYKLLLDTDVLLLDGTRPVDAEDINSPTPTLDNPNCSICHTVVDPVASIFQNWSAMGQYRPTSAPNTGNWYTDMEQRGFNGESMPLSGNIDSSVKWLAGKMASDARFPKAIAKSLHTGLTGQPPLLIPESDVPADASERKAYQAQDAYFGELSNILVQSNYDVREVIKAIIAGPYFRANGLITSANQAAHANTGSERLLTPEMLHRKLIATTGQRWTRNGNDRLVSRNNNSLLILYGGMDSDSITSRITEPNGVISATQRRMASQIACQAVAQDFFAATADRSLFPAVNPQDSLLDDAGQIDPASNQKIIANLQHLHWAMLGVDATADDEEILELRDLMADIQQTGLELIEAGANRRMHFACDLTRHPQTGENLPAEQQIRDDDNYMLRTWQALLVYYLNDYRFVYE